MSRFFSEKYLKYQRRSEGQTIEEDLFCKSCGYNLRGLPQGRRCPECGEDPQAVEAGEYITEGGVRRRPLVDIITIGSDTDRARWRKGLAIATFCVFATIAARLGFFVSALVGGPTNYHYGVYLSVGFAISITWLFSLPFILPSRLGRQWPWMKPLRWYVLGTQWLFAAGYLLWFYEIFFPGPLGPSIPIMIAQRAVRVVAGTGIIVLCGIFRYVSEEAELEKADGRFNFAMWFLPIATVIAVVILATFPSYIATLKFRPEGLLHVIFMMPSVGALLFWCFVLWQFAQGLREMQQRASWSHRLVVTSRSREARIADKRGEMERELEEKVRPTPEIKEDLALEENKGRSRREIR